MEIRASKQIIDTSLQNSTAPIDIRESKPTQENTIIDNSIVLKIVDDLLIKATDPDCLLSSPDIMDRADQIINSPAPVYVGLRVPFEQSLVPNKDTDSETPVRPRRRKKDAKRKNITPPAPEDSQQQKRPSNSFREYFLKNPS